MLVLNLKQILEEYLDFQKEVITRRTSYDLEKAKEREHIIECLVIAVRNIDEVIAIIKKPKDKQDAIEKLQSKFELSEKQGNAILEMKLSRLTGLEVEKLNAELTELCETIKELSEILASPARIASIIREEILQIKDKYARPRKSEVSFDYDDIDIGDLIAKHEVVISLTDEGYIKRMPATEYKSQNRGGKGVVGHKAKDTDVIVNMISCNSHDDLLFFTNLGKVYRMKAYNIPEATKTSKGRAIVNLMMLQGDEKITAIVANAQDKATLFMATEQGYIKKTKMSEFDLVRKNGKIAIKLMEDDQLVSVKAVDEGDELLIASNNGKCVRFSEKDVRSLGRSSRGVKGMKIDAGEKIIDMIVLDPDKDILTVTELGYAKRTKVDDYRLQSRRGKGTKAGRFNDKTGHIVAISPIVEGQDILAITSNGIVIRTHAEQINEVGRTALGVRLMNTSGCKIVGVSVVERQEDDEIDEVVEQTENQDTNE